MLQVSKYIVCSISVKWFYFIKSQNGFGMFTLNYDR